MTKYSFMPKTRSNCIELLLCFVLLFSIDSIAQEKAQDTHFLIPFVQHIENTFDVKFSYVDADIGKIKIKKPESDILEDILDSIKNQTQLQIKKLSNRYYAIIKLNSIDVCGIVLDRSEGNAIVGATIQILHTKKAVITDFNGKFSFAKINSDALIEIKHLGFKTTIIPAKTLANHSPCKPILLQQFYEPLKEVVVYDFLTKGLVQQRDASIKMNTEEFGILPGLIEPDVLQTIQALPGIKSIDETVSDINIRGGSNDQNLILWDGIKMYQSGHFFGLISAFNPHLTDKVTLIKNGTSVKYGDGVSGIIDMRTKNEITDTYYGGAGFNLISADIFGQASLNNKLALQFSARRSLTDFLNTATFRTFFSKAFLNEQVKDGVSLAEDIERNDTFLFYDFTGKLLYDITKNHKLRFSFIKINNLLNYKERSVGALEQSTSELGQTNVSFGGSLESKFSPSFSTHISTYYSRYNLDAENIAPNATQVFFQNNLVIENGLRLSASLKINPSINWLNGYQLNETGITNTTNISQPPFESNIKDVIQAHAFYSELAYHSANDKLQAKGGLRLNYYNNPDTFHELIIEPRININYKFAKAFKIALLGEQKSQATNQVVDLEQNFLGVEKRRWVLSNGENLPIVKSKQASLGFHYEQRKLYIGLEGFYKEVDGISTSTQGFQNQNQFNGEIGKYNTKGIEFLINRKTKNYSIWASYAYNINNYKFSEITPSYFPNNLDIRHTATFAGTYTFNKFKIGIGLNYHTGKPFTLPDSEAPIDDTVLPAKINFQDPNSSRLSEYLRTDASIIYDFNLGTKIKASTGISVLNFTNRTNILNRYYRINIENKIETVESYSLGITPNFSFRLKF